MEGCLERKEAAETKRLGQEKQILKLIKDTAEKCQKTLDKLDLARVGKSNSGSYNKLHKVPEEGAKLNGKTSVNEYGKKPPGSWRSFRKAWAKRTLRSGSGCRETLPAGRAARSVGESVLHGADHI